MWPAKIETEEELEEIMSRPTPETVEAVSKLDGDLIILGAGGKIGPTLARLAKNAVEEAKVDKRVIAVSRFSNPEVRQRLNEAGIETIPCNLLEKEDVDKLPKHLTSYIWWGENLGRREMSL